jgi:hypothetical protein
MNKLVTEGLICLNNIPNEHWKGLKVYHPMLQLGDTAYWKTEDYPSIYRDEDDDESGYCYDEGIILSYSSADEYKDIRVVFDTGNYKLTYGAYNLWVSKKDIMI